MLHISRKVIGPRPLPIMISASVCGIFWSVMMKLNITAFVMMYSSIADMFAELSSTFGTSFRPMSL